MRSIIAAAATVAFAVGLGGCAQTPTFQSGPEAEETFDGLTRLDRTVMDIVWAREGIDLSGYSKILFQGVGVEYRPSTGPYSGRAGRGSLSRNTDTDFNLDDETRALFEGTIRDAFLAEMQRSDVFQVVEEPGEDVLALRAGLLDVVSFVPPDMMGSGAVFLRSVGEATLVLEVRDSVTNAIFARAVDRRAAETPGAPAFRSNRATNTAEVRRLGQRWANTLRAGLEALLSGATPAPPS